MPRRDPDPSVKKDDTYEALRKQGASKEKAARIANAQAAGSIDYRGDKLEKRSKDDLMAEARTIGIKGRSEMSKSELAKAIRHH